MSDDVMIYLCFTFPIVALAAFFLYNTYRGVHDNLANAICGSVYNFRYFQPVTGDYERYLAKVVGVRKLDTWELGRLNFTSDYRAYDKNFMRTPTLVTCQMNNGDYRQFYAERSDMCKRSAVGGLLFKAGVAHLF